MNKDLVTRKYLKKIKLLQKHNKHYHDEDKPVISDQDFDLLKNEGKHFFYECDYKVFFNEYDKLKKSINFYYYDGEHSYKNQFENLIIAKDYFKSGTIILVDDVNFKEVEAGTKDFLSKYPNDYRILKDIKTANDHCHPSYWNGLFLFQKK